MKRTSLIAAFALTACLVITGCGSLNHLPTNTSGGIFSLNGKWSLTTTTDNNAEIGTVIVVLPIVGEGSAKTLANNTYCYREGDVVWKSIKSLTAGGFSLSQLAGACNGTTTYKDATLVIENNDLVKINSQTMVGTALIQEWKRVSN